MTTRGVTTDDTNTYRLNISRKTIFKMNLNKSLLNLVQNRYHFQRFQHFHRFMSSLSYCCLNSKLIHQKFSLNAIQNKRQMHSLFDRKLLKTKCNSNVFSIIS